MNYIYILLLTEIILLVIAFIACGRDIMSPSVVMVGVFLIATIFAVLNVENWNIEYSFSAYILLSTGLGVFIFTESFFMLSVRCWKERKPIEGFQSKRNKELLRFNTGNYLL